MSYTKQRIIAAAAEAMQKGFPVVKNGADENGDWCIKPLDISVFIRAVETALEATPIWELLEMYETEASGDDYTNDQFNAVSDKLAALAPESEG